MIYPLLEIAHFFFLVGRQRCNLITLIQTWTKLSQASIIALVKSLYLSDFSSNESEIFSCSIVSYSLRLPWTVAHQVPLSMEFSRQEY